MQTGIMNEVSERLPAGIPSSSLYTQIHAAMLSGDHNDKNFVF